MPVKITAYECVHGCGKYLKTKKSIVNHELYCFWNPARKACMSCGNRIMDDEYGSWCDALELDLNAQPPGRKSNLKNGCSQWISKHNKSLKQADAV